MIKPATATTKTEKLPTQPPLELIHKIIDYVEDRQTLIEVSCAGHATHENANRQLWRNFAYITQSNLHLIIHQQSFYAKLITDLTLTGDGIFDNMHPDDALSLPQLRILRLSNISRFPSHLVCKNNPLKLTIIEMKSCSIDFMPYHDKDHHNLSSFFTHHLEVLRLENHHVLMDDDLQWIARWCQNLRILDLTCSGSYITDDGLLSITHANPNLEELIVTLPPSVQSIHMLTTCSLEALQYYCKSMKRVTIKDRGFAMALGGHHDRLKLWGFPCLEYYDFGYESYVVHWSKNKT